MRPAGISRGFTLIEVLVAMVVMGAAVTALFGLLSSSLFNLRKLEDVHHYQLAAEEVMNRLQFVSTFPAEGKLKGRVPDLDATWNVTVSPWFPATLQEKPAQAIMKIDVNLSWDGRAGQRNIRLETVRPVNIAYENYDFQQALDKAIPR